MQLYHLYCSFYSLQIVLSGNEALVPFASPPPHAQLTLPAYHHKFEKSHLAIALGFLGLLWFDLI